MIGHVYLAMKTRRSVSSLITRVCARKDTLMTKTELVNNVGMNALAVRPMNASYAKQFTTYLVNLVKVST
jgi:hypothetical protein